MQNKSVFDKGRVMRTIRRICRDCEFIPVGFNQYAIPDDRLTTYLQASQQRLHVFVRRLKRLGYNVELSQFEHRGKTGINCLAYWGNVVEPGSLLFVAHHDYCAGVGAEDNATALATMLELARIFAGSRRICFASFDLEELGVVGSKAFVSGLTDEQFARFSKVVDLECLGSGKDIIVCERVSGAVSDPELIDAVMRAAKRAGHELPMRSYDYFYADHVPFARRGAKTIEIGSADAHSTMSQAQMKEEWERVLKGEPRSDGSVAHTGFDQPQYIKGKNLQIVGDVLVELLKEHTANL
jgi:hypothetical protein